MQPKPELTPKGRKIVKAIATSVETLQWAEKAKTEGVSNEKLDGFLEEADAFLLGKPKEPENS